MSGADQTQAEMRLPSIKGVLRYWMRAVNPSMREELEGTFKNRTPVFEELMLGSSHSAVGQSKFLFRWERVPTVHGQYVKEHPDFTGLHAVTSPFQRGQVRRAYFTARQKPQTLSFRIFVRPAYAENERMWKTLLAGLWLLGHVGGLGTNTRRGFGTAALERWTFDSFPNGDAWKDELPNAHQAKSMEEWITRFEQGMSTINRWFKPQTRFEPFSPLYPCLNAQSRIFYHERSEWAWQRALQQAIRPLQTYRRLDDGMGEQDPERIKRLALGMPSVMWVNGRKLIYNVKGRFPSPVWLRTIQINRRYYPLVLFMSTPYPPEASYKDLKAKKLSKPFALKGMGKGLVEFGELLRKSGFIERKIYR
jgi:CRISPR-associated protein Cmr1